MSTEPKIIISAGRRTAPIALALKKLSLNQTKIIQIMNPNLNFKKFDFVILPKHDGFDEKKYPNLITTIGALNKVDQEIIEIEKEKFSQEFANLSKIKIALMLGGSSNKSEFDRKSAKKLAKICSKIAKNMNAILIILNSRRTGDEITDIVKSSLDCDFKFFNWKDCAQNNPYLAILGFSDFFIVTGDSVSMICECCFTEKPVYIFDEKNISTKKHRIFHQNLIAKNYAKKLKANSENLEIFYPQKLEETKRVAKLINDKF